MQTLETLQNEMILRNFSRETIAAYLFANEKFLQSIRKPADEVTQADIERYLLLLAGKGLAAATRHLMVSALRFYYCAVLRSRFRLVYPKIGTHLPLVITKENILRMIDATSNIKHKLLLVLLYSSGLRVSEAVKLKPADTTDGTIMIDSYIRANMVFTASKEQIRRKLCKAKDDKYRQVTNAITKIIVK